MKQESFAPRCETLLLQSTIQFTFSASRSKPMVCCGISMSARPDTRSTKAPSAKCMRTAFQRLRKSPSCMFHVSRTNDIFGEAEPTANTFLWECLAFGSRLPCGSDGGLRSITPVSFPSSGKERRLAGCCVSIPRGSGSPLVCSHDFVRLSNFVGSLRACAFLYGDPDGVRRDAGNGVGGAAWGRFCVSLSALQCFPQGVRWGLRAPKPAPKSHWLSGLSSFNSRQSTSCQTSQ